MTMTALSVVITILVCIPINVSSFVFHGNNHATKSHRNNKQWLLKSAELHTAYEYIARQRGIPISECIKWIDPSETIVPPPPPKQMGFQINTDAPKEETKENNSDSSDSSSLRLPIYPVSAVHLPSSAFHTLHNTQLKNIRMSRDLEANKWTVAINQGQGLKDDKGLVVEDKRQCFVLTLYAQDTHRIASIGTLVEVTSMKETYANDKTLIRIVVECRSLGIVEIEGMEREGIVNEHDYLVGRVRMLDDGTRQEEDDRPSINIKTMDDYNLVDMDLLQNIVQDYATVRSMYIHTDGVASRELPPFARDAVQANLPTFTQEDFVSRLECG